MHTDDRGLAITTTSAEAAAEVNAAIGAYLEYRLSAMDHVKAALAADPACLLAQCLRGYFLLLIGTERTVPQATKALAEAERLARSATERERGHVTALRAWAEMRYYDADQAWQRILIDHPTDVLALRLQHFNAFWLGRADLLRDVPASVVAAWDKGLPGYGNVIGMLGFGLEETGDLARAEKLGREAVEINKDDLWSVHAVAHVLETAERYEDGLIWLNQPHGTWADRNPFADHIWWHRALYALELGDDTQVLELFDNEIHIDESGFYLDVQNAASLLARLELVGVDVGTRWDELGEVAAGRIGDHMLPFTDAHMLLALVRARRLEDAARYLDSLAQVAAAGEGERAKATREVLLPLGRSLIAWGRGDHGAALDAFYPIRHSLTLIGGSHAQRDVFAQLGLDMAVRSRRKSIARRLLSERQVLRPQSRYLQIAHEQVA